MYPKLKELYDIVNKLRSIFRSKKLTRDEAKAKLHEWYQSVADCTIREIKSARDAIKSREENVLNYFIDRSTNASAESFNSKLKAFRAQHTGRMKFVTPFVGAQVKICEAFGFPIPDCCAPVYVSKAKQTTRRRGRPAKPKVEKQTF